MLRDVEELSTTDAADVLEITEENVKVSPHRARALLRKSLCARAGMERKEAFAFHAVRCDRVVKNVFERIQKRVSKTEVPRQPRGDIAALKLEPLYPEFSTPWPFISWAVEPLGRNTRT